MTVINAVSRYTLDGSAAALIQFTGSDGTTPFPGVQPFDPIVIDSLTVDGCGYGVVYLSGLNVQIGHRTLQDTGERRVGVPPSLPASFGDYVQYGQLKVLGQSYYPEYRSFADPDAQGEIIVMPDPVALRIGTYIHSVDAALYAYPRSIATNILVTVAFSTSRSIILSGDGAVPGDRYTIDYVATGGAAAKVKNKTLALSADITTLASAAWARFVYNGVDWRLEDQGSLTP